ncbi:MAG TPA: helix-turn-helix domain-containing protein [Candidatus Paceibacterota bacterium]|nr:helix-turn-helix domain-containing protein [Candidatus Paceibacterota bacterium]
MYQFKDLLKQIRSAAGLTQEELGTAVGVSTILVSMVETGQKEPSKAFVVKLADTLGVRPSSIMPFVLADEDGSAKLSGVEKALMSAGEKLQTHLIQVKAKRLKRYAKEAVSKH